MLTNTLFASFQIIAIRQHQHNCKRASLPPQESRGHTFIVTGKTGTFRHLRRLAMK
jgi:hypothetical protein